MKPMVCMVTAAVWFGGAGLSGGRAAELPPDSEYVVVRDGHLSLGGERVRYWAVIGGVYVPANARAADSPAARAEKVATACKGTDVLVRRYGDLGFNACRFWGGINTPTAYTRGDGSAADSMDYFLYRMKQAGLKVWAAGLNNAGVARPEDVGIVDDPATAGAWQAAVQQMSRKVTRRGVTQFGAPIRNHPARAWDPRLEAIGIRNMRNVAHHLNRHTGLRWADDPVFVAWELSNEEWWMRRMLGGSWQKLPAFFRNQLVARWNAFLKGRYATRAKLRAAWGELLAGESLADGTVLLAPMAKATDAATSVNDANPHARAVLAGLKQQYTREDFAPQRARDVLAFLLDLQLAHKKREAKAVKSWGKSTRLCPLVWDTGIGYEIQSQYLHQHADAVAHDAYVNGTGPRRDVPAPDPADVHSMRATLDAERIRANRGRWVNWLRKPPGICQGVPWLEHNRVEGKPFFCYETQIQQPAKYRADFPLRLAALASIQDWDFVCWHYFGAVPDAGTHPRPFDKRMDVTTGSHPQGYHYTYDEVQNAMMRAAGLLWRHEALTPAPKPTRFVYGRKSLYDPASMDYGGSYGADGMDMLQTVYQHGGRIEIDPTREDDEVIGPVVKFADRNQHNPYTPTKQITFDWKKGFLRLDAPAAVAFAGLMANVGEAVSFDAGVTLRDVRIRHPEGIYERVGDDEKYIAFALVSRDGKPLAACGQATLSLVSTSFNTGFRLADPAGGGRRTVAGTTPVLVARVGGVVRARALAGMRYELLDWHMGRIGSGQVGEDGVLEVPADKPVFCVQLTRGGADGGWVSLFNGKDLAGWKQRGNGVFKVVDGMLIGTQTDGKGGDLYTTGAWGSFELRATYRMTWPANSGFWYRYDPAGRGKGYQYDILKYPKPVAFSGTLYCPGKMFLFANLDESVENRDGWNEARVLADGDRLVHWLNGKKMGEARDKTLTAGRIGIQVHGGNAFKGMKIEVKRLEVRAIR